MSADSAQDLLARELAQQNNNFLVPNGTFFAELVIFAIVLFVLGRFVVPPVRKALTEREEMVRRQARESQQASEQYAAAQTRHRETLTEARAEASRIRDEARAAGRRVGDEQRARAEHEVARIRERGERQLAEQQAVAVGRLREELGPLAGMLADRILGQDGIPGQDEASDGDRRAIVEQFRSELDAASPTVVTGRR